ncbi:MAG: TolC family protein [Planctomycetes bacterium]|nr:TolC family protein [Planctomycetota bacterium]
MLVSLFSIPAARGAVEHVGCGVAFAARVRASSAAIACLLGACVLAACAQYRPRPLVAEQELADLRARTLDALRIEYAESVAGVDAPPRTFDPSDGLDEAELAAVALTLDPALRARRGAIGEVQALRISAGLLPNPELGASIRPGMGAASGTALGFDLLFLLLRPDERPARRAAAEAQVGSVRAEIEAEELRLVADVRRARIAVLAAQQSARLLRQEQALRDEALARVHEQHALGEAAQLAIALVELDRTSVQRELRAAEAAVERARRSLRALLGIPPATELRLAGEEAELTFTIVPEPTDEALDARLLAEHPELRARAADYERAEAELRLAIAGQFPSVRIGPSFEQDVEGGQSLGLGASVELPLFDRNQGAIAARSAARDRARAEYVAVLHRLRARAFDARAELHRARTEVELQRAEVLPLVERSEALFEAAFRARELSVFEWMTARARSIQARRELLDALTRYASAAVELDASTGAFRVVVSSAESDATAKQ